MASPIFYAKRETQNRKALLWRATHEPALYQPFWNAARPRWELSSSSGAKLKVKSCRILIRFCIYGLLGWCWEVVWTALTEKAWGKQRDWRLTGHTYLWMFPIYGLLAPIGEPVHTFMRPHFWLLRGLTYLLGIWLVEFATGWLLRKLTGKCPWDYSHFPGNIQGIITLEYAPVWFIFGLGFERVHDALVKLTPAIETAIAR